MSQRYTPSQLGVPLIENGNTPGLYPSTAMSAAEFNTLILVVLFGNSGGSCRIRPWVNIKSKDGAGVKIDNWLPLAEVTITAVDDTLNQPDPAAVGAFRAPPMEVAIPNCHECKVELLSDIGTTPAPTTVSPTTGPSEIGYGSLTLWAAMANRAPR